MVVNDCMVTYGIAESPFGGVNESGIGRVNGEIGLKSYCHVQSVAMSRFVTKREYLRYPYSAKKLRFVRKVIDFLYRSRLGKLFGN